jgi:hypothetical protein
VAVSNIVLLSDILSSAYQRPRRETHQDIVDLEFSDYGRDPRFLPGWWIFPGMLIGAALASWVAGSL